MGRGYTNDRRLASVQLRTRRVTPVAGHRWAAAVLVVLATIACLPARAQQASQPGYDPRQTEKRFDTQQLDQAPAGRPRLPTPQFARPTGREDTKPLFVLHHV